VSPELLYVVGTLLTWFGWVFVARFVVLGARWITNVSGLDPTRTKTGLITSGLGGALALILGAAIPMKVGVNVVPNAGVRFPLIWFVMPYAAWLAVISLSFALLRGSQALLSITPRERGDKLKSVGVCLVLTVAFVALYRTDPANRIVLIRGGIPFGLATASATVVLLAIATVGMIWAGRAATSRGYANGTVTQAALLAGSVLFGLPFAFLVITSFKEDQDMSSPNGIVWVPHVQESVPFYDKSDPLYEGTYQGQTVQATVMRKGANGELQLDIQKPLSIRGTTFDAKLSELKEVTKDGPVVAGPLNGVKIVGYVDQELLNGLRRVHITQPSSLAGKEHDFEPALLKPVRHAGLKWQNYPDALSYLPPETNNGLGYLQNTLIIVILSVIGTILSCAIVSYAFSRMKFPGKEFLFTVVLSTMMLPAAVTLMPQFLIFRDFGWIDTLLPLWVPAFFGSAFNIFLLRQFFMQIPMELEDAAKIDGCSYIRTFWRIMLPQIKPALAVVAVTTFVGAWNNFMGPLIYISSPEHMPLSYALQLFQSDRGNEPGLLMAFATLCMLPVLAVFFFAQRYFIEGVTLSGLGGR
jgi:multiple sugar transport system permease protein